MIVNCRRLRNILSFFPYLSVNCICASLPKIVDRIRHEGGEAPRAGLLKIIYTTVGPESKRDARRELQMQKKEGSERENGKLLWLRRRRETSSQAFFISSCKKTIVG